MTLVELVVAMSMLSVVLLIFTSVLASVQRTVVENQRYSEANDAARLALQQLDRELRSGNVINDPRHAADRLSREQQPLDLHAGEPSDARASAVRDLEDHRRPRAPGTTMDRGVIDVGDPWRTVAEHIVNQTTGVDAFKMNSDPLKGERTIDICLQVNPDIVASPGRTIDIRGR